MKIRAFVLAYAAAFGSDASLGGAHAGALDYRFEPAAAEVANGDGTILAIRLVRIPTAKPVSGAINFRTRLDMSPDAMAEMTARHEALGEAEPGVYRFKANLNMAGGWALKLMAKVQGEAETVTGVVRFLARD